MAWGDIQGYAKTDPRNPRAKAVCDNCGTWYLHADLQWQFDWAGTKLINQNVLVCRRCLSKPQPQLRSIILPPDPVPIENPRPEFAELDYTTFRITMAGDTRTTMNGNTRIVPANTYSPPLNVG